MPDHVPGDSAAREAAQAAFEEFLDAAIALGGTVTGEHGVGILKRDGMRRELDPGSLALQAAVRRALDPARSSTPARARPCRRMASVRDIEVSWPE